MSTKTIKIIIFADLDGSLLNHKYENKKIEPILNHLQSINVSIVFNSSKTAREIDYYRIKWKINDPFVAETGSVILVPENYFKVNYSFSKNSLGYNIIELGTPYNVIRKKLSTLDDQVRGHILGFGDMTAEEIAKDSGLTKELAQLAKKRQNSEPFKIIGGNEKQVLQAITKTGLCYTRGGRYFHALGNCDKGKATSILKDLYTQQFGEILTIGIGDSANDLEMLKIVDKAFYVKKRASRNSVWNEIDLIAQRFNE